MISGSEETKKGESLVEVVGGGGLAEWIEDEEEMSSVLELQSKFFPIIPRGCTIYLFYIHLYIQNL
jgi:hypothetical protein